MCTDSNKTWIITDEDNIKFFMSGSWWLVMKHNFLLSPLILMHYCWYLYKICILIWQSSFFLIRTNMHRTELCHEGWCSEICCKTWYNNCSPRYKSTYVLFSLFDVLYVYLLTRWYYHTGYKYYFRIFTQK